MTLAFPVHAVAALREAADLISRDLGQEGYSESIKVRNAIELLAQSLQSSGRDERLYWIGAASLLLEAADVCPSVLKRVDAEAFGIEEEGRR